MGKINIKTYQKRIAYKDINLYVTSSETYSRITSEMLIQYASENSGIPEAQMAAAFLALKKEVNHYILNGHSLELMDLGTLYLSVNAKAVVEEEDAGTKAIKRVSMKFRQGKKLRNMINNNVQLVNVLTKKQEESSEGQENEDNSGTNGSGNGTGNGSGNGSNTGGDNNNGGGGNTPPDNNGGGDAD